jgi:hypothetical protein
MSRARDVANLGSDTTNLEDISSAYNAGALSNRNKIINGEFQISQRGDYTSATSLTGTSTYYLDRFKARAVGVTATFEQNVNQTLDNNDVVNTFRMDVTSTATGRVEATQIIEDFNWFKNKTITFSARVKSNSTNARLVFNADGGGGTTASSAHTGGGGWELLTGTATLTSGVTGVQLYAGIQAAGTGDVAGVTSGDYFEVSEVQLEAGTVATPFEHRSYGQELALCQRYFQTVSNGAGGVAGNTTVFTFGMVFPTPMRASPSSAVTAAIRISDITTSAYTQSSGDIANNLVTPESGSFTLGNFSGMTTGRFAILAQSSSGTIQLSSEL